MSHQAPEDGQPPTMTDGTAETTERTADTSKASQSDVHPAAEDPHALLSVNRVQKYFPIKQGILFQRQVGAVKAVDGVSFSIRRRRDARAGGRVRMRQVDDRAGDHPTARARPAARSLRRAGHRASSTASQMRPLRARHPDDLPGPLLVAEPAAHHRHDRRGAVPDPEGQDREGHQGRGADAAWSGSG